MFRDMAISSSSEQDKTTENILDEELRGGNKKMDSMQTKFGLTSRVLTMKVPRYGWGSLKENDR
jgi:hypothetical protein